MNVQWPKDQMRCQFAEILKVYQILMYKIIHVGTHSKHICSLLSSLIFSYKSHYIYLFFYFLCTWYAQWYRTLWIHSLSSTGALQECVQAEELAQECYFYKNANKLRSFDKNLLVGDWPILCGCEQAFQGPPRTSQHIAAHQLLPAKKSL